MDARPPLELHLHSPEITLKGRNKRAFWAQLQDNATMVLRALDLSWPVQRVRGRLFVEAVDYTSEALGKALDALERLAGVTSIPVAIRYPREDIAPDGVADRGRFEDVVLHLARETYAPGKSFAVRVRRVDKRFALSAAELEKWLGQVIRDRTEWDQVRLNEPDQTFYIDIYTDSIFFYGVRAKGVGGLPVGTSGHVVSLLSGGIDSPVASYLMARRGCSVDWLHMSATHVTAEGLVDSVPDRLARELSRYTLRSRMCVVPYTHFDLALSGRSTGYEPVLFRRFLFRVGAALARRASAVALVTGDSLSQVASQTIENLIASDKAVDVPVLRPLIGFDKQEIMDLGEKIGTYPISIEPYKDCCALYAQNARTRTRDRVLSSIEENDLPESDALVAASLADSIWIEYCCGERRTVEDVLSLSGQSAR